MNIKPAGEWTWLITQIHILPIWILKKNNNKKGWKEDRKETKKQGVTTKIAGKGNLNLGQKLDSLCGSKHSSN